MNRKLLFFITAGLLFCTIGIAQGATTLMQIGRSPFHQPPLTSVDELISMVQSKEAEVKKGFALAGKSELFAPFMEQVTKGQIDKVEFQRGSTFEWMFYKKKGKGALRVVKDVTWGNVEPFPGFKFDVDHKGKSYTFAVPLGCGNVALMGMSDSKAVASAPVTVIAPPNKAPQCGMSVSSVRAFCGEIITVDASGSADSDGDIASMTIAFLDDQGQIVSEKIVDGGGLVGEVAMPCGANTLKVTLTDNDGAEATSSACTAAVTGTSRVRFIADLGLYRQFDPGSYFFGRVGAEYQFNEQWSVLGLLGGAAHFQGSDGKSAFMADLLAEYKFSRYFVDFGVGGWITDGDDDLKTENSQLDLIAAIGARVYGEPETFNASLFLEVRSGVEELDEIDEYGRFGLGVRFRF